MAAARTDATSSSATGRPRDPAVDARITQAAATVFGAEGWAGFTVDAVARRAGVGKASIYLRWPNKEALLVAALEARITRVADIDTGSVHDDLVQLAQQLLRSYLGDSGRAAIRLLVEADSVPGVDEHVTRLQEAQIRAARAIVRRGIGRGELHRTTSVTLLLDAIAGGCLNHVLATPQRLRAQVTAGADQYAVTLVDFALRAVAARPSPE